MLWENTLQDCILQETDERNDIIKKLQPNLKLFLFCLTYIFRNTQKEVTIKTILHPEGVLVVGVA